MPEKKKEATFTELQELAKEMNISGWFNMNKAELTIATARNEEGSEKFVYDRAIGVSKEDMAELRAKNEQVPSKTIMWKKDQDLVMEIINRNRYAFNNYNLTDPMADVQHHFETSTKCHNNRVVPYKVVELGSGAFLPLLQKLCNMEQNPLPL